MTHTHSWSYEKVPTQRSWKDTSHRSFKTTTLLVQIRQIERVSVHLLTDVNLSVMRVNQLSWMVPGMAVYFVSVLAAIILIGACYNYTNLIVARAMARAHEVAIRKVVGAYRRQIIGQILMESILTVFLADVFCHVAVGMVNSCFQRDVLYFIFSLGPHQARRSQRSDGLSHCLWLQRRRRHSCGHLPRTSSFPIRPSLDLEGRKFYKGSSQVIQSDVCGGAVWHVVISSSSRPCSCTSSSDIWYRPTMDLIMKI